jgi:hypothetical protein
VVDIKRLLTLDVTTDENRASMIDISFSESTYVTRFNRDGGLEVLSIS